ncbi:MAG: hypothetical protein ABL998_03500, partial [Planctomycetota bacterium]
MAWIATTALVFLGQAAAPKASEQKTLIEAYFAADAMIEAGQKERRRIQRELAPLELDPAEAPKQLADILKRWEKGARLESKPGQRFWWEREKRGLYIVGGQTKKPKALVLCLHEGKENKGDARKAFNAYESTLSDLGWLAIYPEELVQTPHGWIEGGTEEWILELIDCARRTWKIDPDRVYLCGHSVGGYGTWTLGAHHADQFAALAPSAGAPTPLLGRSQEVLGIVEGIVPNLRNLAVCFYQSSDDRALGPEINRLVAKLLGEAKALHGGYDFEFWEVAGRGHSPPPGGFEAHLAKIAEIERVTHPDTVVWQPTLAWKQQ